MEDKSMKGRISTLLAIAAVSMISLFFSVDSKAQYRMSYEIGAGSSMFTSKDKSEPGFTFFNEIRFYTGKWVDLGIRLEDNFSWGRKSESNANFNDNALGLKGVANFNCAFASDFNPYIGVEVGGSVMHHQDLDKKNTICYTDLVVGPRIGIEIKHHLRLGASYQYNFFHERFSYVGFNVSWSFEI